MGTLLSYSIATAFCLATMAIIYKLLLSQTTLFKFNRAFLLGTLIISPFIYPLQNLSLDKASITGDIILKSEDIITTAIGNNIDTDIISILSLLVTIYIIGVILLSLRFIISIFRIFYIIMKSEKRDAGKYTLILHNDTNITPFSWGKWIIMSHNEYIDCGDMGIIHETGHLDSKHWLDLVLAEAMIIFCWYNPFAWLVKRELHALHEYEADFNVINNNINEQEYQLFLIRKTVGSRFASITNSLNHSSIKKRITMMLSKRSSRKACMRALVAVPALALISIVLNSPASASVLSEISSTETIAMNTPQSKVTKKSSNSSTNERKADKKAPMTIAEKMPQYNGGPNALNEFIAKNIQYPKSARENKIEGNVVVRFTVTAEGKTTDHTVLRSVDPELDAEAIRVTKMLDNFTPGEVNGEKVAVQYTIPIFFKLQ